MREAYSSVRFLAQHLPIEQLYGLRMAREDAEDCGGRWSALALAEALAEKRGYHVAKTGRPDAHAAGREILYDTQDGVVPLYFLPPTDGEDVGGGGGAGDAASPGAAGGGGGTGAGGAATA